MLYQKGTRNEIVTPPTLVGAHTKAWQLPIKAAPTHDTITHWLVEAPWAHPAWHSYYIGTIHLRHEGVLRYVEGGTHELVVAVIDPRVERQRIVDGDTSMKGIFLAPLNFAAQFIELDDEMARDRIKRTVQEIVDEKLSPDTDYVRDWVRLFGGNMLQDHYKEGLRA